jgi:glycosyltransferase involved in cell wall biosynthesis
MVDDIQNRPVQLSVCVIGRNEGKHLAACAASLEQLDMLRMPYETIFVDSASTDSSVPIARVHFDKVICLDASGYLNAGAARHIGTNACSGTWVLYMDGDMELSPEIIPAIRALLESGAQDRGLCAYTENVFPDGTRDLIEFKGNRPDYPCRMIGGTSILPRQKVIEAGNWSCRLYAYEEAELYCRLADLGTQVIWHACRLVEHKTPKVPLSRKLAGVLVPYRSYLGKKFYGAGQVTCLTLSGGHFMSFARKKPEAYIMTASLVLAAAFAPLLSWFALFLPSTAFAVNLARLGLRGAINQVCWQMQLVCGLWKQVPAFEPRIQQILVRQQADNAEVISTQ